MNTNNESDWDFTRKNRSDEDDLIEMVKNNTNAIERMMQFMQNMHQDKPNIVPVKQVPTTIIQVPESEIMHISELGVDPRYHPVKRGQVNNTLKFLRTPTQRNDERYLDSVRYWLKIFQEAQEPISIWWSMYEEPLENTVLLKAVDRGRIVVSKLLAKEVNQKGFVPERTWFIDHIFGIGVPRNTSRLNAKRTMERFFKIPFDPKMKVDISHKPSVAAPAQIESSVSINMSPASKEESGRDYELYLAHELMNAGYHVTYHGVTEGKNDGGIDLIAEKDGCRRLIQAKHWKSSMQLFDQDIIRIKRDFDSWVDNNGDKLLYPWNKDKDTYELFVSDHGIISSDALDVCKRNGIKVSKEIRPYKKDWPRIKGIVSNSSNARGKKIAYGPDHNSYVSESCQMAGRRGHRWFNSFEEAEEAGYVKGGSKR